MKLRIGLILLAGIMVTAPQARSAEKPNVVFFLVDDLGVMDLSYYGSEFHESPNIDRLADEGARFVNAYASHPAFRE